MEPIHPDYDWVVLSPAEGNSLLGYYDRFRHPEVPLGDVRCDLHPRWSRDGRYLSVDTIHFGERKICLLEMSSLCAER